MKKMKKVEISASEAEASPVHSLLLLQHTVNKLVDEVVRLRELLEEKEAGWLMIPRSISDDQEAWLAYHRADKDHCWVKFEDGSVMRYKGTTWPLSIVTHYKIL